MLKEAGLPAIRVHDMRHTYANLLISKGADLAYVKDQLGHASIKTTSDIYGHLIPGSQRHLVNSLDGPFTPPPALAGIAHHEAPTAPRDAVPFPSSMLPGV